jgi:hypothetical protein
MANLPVISTSQLTFGISNEKYSPNKLVLGAFILGILNLLCMISLTTYLALENTLKSCPS